MPQKREIRPLNENIGVGKASESPPRDTQVTPKETSLFQHVQGEGVHHPSCGLHATMKVQATLCLHEQAFTWQGPTKTNKYTLQWSTSHKYHASKPYLIKEPTKHVHQIPPFQNKHMLKDLVQFPKFRYGRGVIVPYWVNQFLE